MSKSIKQLLSAALVIAMLATLLVVPAAAAGDGKIDVWDFGAEQLDSAKFNNKLTVDIINSWTPGSEPGTKGPNLAGFTSTQGNGLAFNDGGFTASHRLRSTNTALTRYDDKSLAGAKGSDPYFPNATAAITYTGYIYDNKGKTDTVNLALDVNAGDIVTFLAGSNSAAATYAFTSPSGKVVTGEYTKAAKVEPLTFYPGETGTYKLHCTNEKLVVARIYRKPATEVAVSGAVTAPADIPAGYQIVFTDLDNQTTVEAAVTGGSYSAALFQGHRYTVSLKGADEYIISSEKSVDLTAETGTAKTLAVTIQGVPMAAVSTTISGVTTAPAASAKVVLAPKGADAIYQPAPLALANGTTAMKLEKGRDYDVQLENANDYYVVSPDTAVKFDADGSLAVQVDLKPTYKVTIAPEGLTLADLADATFTFTSINETYEGADGKSAPYTYTFTGPDAIALRDGQYKMAVDTAKGVQKVTADVRINGAPFTRSVGFETDLTVDAGTHNMAADTAGNHSIKGVTWGDGAKHDNSHGPYNFTTMKLNLKANATVTFKTCCYGQGCTIDATTHEYQGGITLSDPNAQLTVTTEEEGAGKPYRAVATITGAAAGELTITFASKPYIPYLAVEYAAGAPITQDVEVPVGPTRTYKTINAAMDYVEGLNRAEGVRAILVIDPGNYEELVQVNVPNVTFKNAKAADAKLELKNKGVDIGDNEVRVTWYYGEKHDYYSMTTNNQFDEDVLKANQENGYLSYTNHTGKIDNQSYWNSTVSLNADGFAAEGIIFENSYNQYMSAAAVRDTIVPKGSSDVDRESLSVGSTEVQKKEHVGQAAAVGLGNNVGKASFDHCAFVGRQDVVFGGVGTKMAFYDCELYGGTDYIMGDMNALFAKCDLVMNTNEGSSSDVAYITAASQEQTSQRGFLFWNCTVRSAVPGVETASTKDSKPGTFGRPWKAAAEAVFYETVVGTTTTKADGTTGEKVSLLQPEGWTNGLNGMFDRCAEYRTHEMEGAKRVPMHNTSQGQPAVLTEPVLKDGTKIDYKTWLGGWEPFADKDMTVVCPGGHDEPVVDDVDKTALETAIAQAETVYDIDRDTIYVLADDTTPIKVEKGQKFILEKDVKALEKAIADAKAVLADETADQAAVDAAKTALEKAVADFKKAIKTGTKGSGSNTGATSGRPSDDRSDNNTSTLPFTDVKAEDWFYDNVKKAFEKGLMNGTGATTFEPDATTTRAMIATILYRLGGEKKTDVANLFNDVVADSWYTDAAAWAAEKEIVKGYDETTFAPNDNITREQLVVMLYRYAAVTEKSTKDLSAFHDADAVSDWATEAMTWAVEKGIILGRGNGTLDPKGPASRAEVCTVLVRFLEMK